MDGDFFKKVNDTYGHQTGDFVLTFVATYINKNIRESDFVMRYGGEEFAIILPETRLDQAKLVVEKLRSVLAKASIQYKSNTITITASFGGTVLSGEALQNTQNSDMMIGLADKALYLAKEKGRNRAEWVD